MFFHCYIKFLFSPLCEDKVITAMLRHVTICIESSGKHYIIFYKKKETG